MALTLVALLLCEQHSDRLIHRLGAEDYAVREAATARLVAMGRQRAASILGRARVHRDPEVRARARAVLRRFNSPPPAEEHRWALYVDPFERGGPVAKSYFYYDDEEPIRPVMTEAVLSGSPPNDASIHAWIEKLGADSYTAREAAMEKLRKAGTRTEAPLRQGAASRDREVAFRARALLEGFRRQERTSCTNRMDMWGGEP